ncbi:MAG TPA: 6-carboxytetrahydropterin synthase [Chloroflexota bacterium]|jgi:6-pyruvoyltetrahydropterin/6-carboxytetrahydropterin synthase|nr:6-carboxytetrahydropterin synthase [Chloroflexota bacterium]
MFEVAVVGQFEAAHRLRGDFGPATHRHGHTYRVEVTARGPTLHPDGTLLDITRLQDALREVAGALHYRDLEEVAELAELNTTVETLAHYLFERIAERLGEQGLSSLRVRLWESPTASASYEEAFS